MDIKNTGRGDQLDSLNRFGRSLVKAPLEMENDTKSETLRKRGFDV